VAVFQPHRYTRTVLLRHLFGGAFDACRRVYVTDIYAAGEEPIEGVSSKNIVSEIKKRGKTDVRHEADLKSLLKTLVADLTPGDVVVTLGAGDIWRFGESLLCELRVGKESVKC